MFVDLAEGDSILEYCRCLLQKLSRGRFSTVQHLQAFGYLWLLDLRWLTLSISLPSVHVEEIVVRIWACLYTYIAAFSCYLLRHLSTTAAQWTSTGQFILRLLLFALLLRRLTVRLHILHRPSPLKQCSFIPSLDAPKL